MGGSWNGSWREVAGVGVMGIMDVHDVHARDSTIATVDHGQGTYHGPYRGRCAS